MSLFQRMPGTTREDEVRSIIVGALQYVEDCIGFASTHAPDYVKMDRTTLVGWNLFRETQVGRTIVAREKVRSGDFLSAFAVTVNLRNDLQVQAVDVPSVRCRRELVQAVAYASLALGALRIEGLEA